MPTDPRRDRDPQSPILSAVRESQAAVIDVVRAWTDIAQQLTRDLRLPIARIDLDEAVDRVFDVAEQTLAVQRELVHTVVGVAGRQVDTAVDTAVEAVDTAVEAQVQPVQERAEQDRRPDGRTYEERSVEELRERAAALDIEGRSSMSKDELITALRNHRRSRSGRTDTPRQDQAPDRRTYEERSIEELRERARELDIEGRSTMTKDELIAALRRQAR